MDRAVRCRAEDGEHRQHLVILHELASLLDGLGWTIGVIVGDVVDLASIDAALLVYHLEEAGLYLANATKGGRWPAVGNDVAELDFRVGRARVILLLGGCRLYDERRSRRCDDGDCDQMKAPPQHARAPRSVLIEAEPTIVASSEVI